MNQEMHVVCRKLGFYSEVKPFYASVSLVKLIISRCEAKSPKVILCITIMPKLEDEHIAIPNRQSTLPVTIGLRNVK